MRNDKEPASTVQCQPKNNKKLPPAVIFLKHICHFGIEISPLTLEATTRESKESVGHRCNFKKWKTPLAYMISCRNVTQKSEVKNSSAWHVYS